LGGIVPTRVRRASFPVSGKEPAQT